MNSLTNKLIDCKAGCHINMQCINFTQMIFAHWHQPAIAMQCMLDIGYNYGLDNDVLFSPLKSICMFFQPKGHK